MRLVVVLAVVSACEFPRPSAIYGDGGDSAAGDGVPRDTATDATVDAPRCDPAKPFGSPTSMAALNVHARDFNARLSADELTMYYTCGDDLCTSTRATTSGSFATSQPLAALNTQYEENAATVTADGLTVYFESTRPGGVGLADIYVAHRTTAAGGWGAALRVPSINTAANDYDPYVTPDGSRLYWWALNGGQFSSSTSAWTKQPVSYGGTAFDGNIVVSGDQLTAYVAASTGNINTFQVSRTTSTAAFGSPTSLPALDSAGLDAPSWISADGCVLYLFRGPANVPNVFTLYVAARPL